jgi:hypothetical protein
LFDDIFSFIIKGYKWTNPRITWTNSLLACQFIIDSLMVFDVSCLSIKQICLKEHTYN